MLNYLGGISVITGSLEVEYLFQLDHGDVIVEAASERGYCFGDGGSGGHALRDAGSLYRLEKPREGIASSSSGKECSPVRTSVSAQRAF